MNRLIRQRLRWVVVSLLMCWTIASCQQLFSEAPSRPSTVVVRSAYGALGELFQTEIVNLGLEALGYQVVEGLEIEYDVLHEAVARGYLEYTASHWHNLHAPYFNRRQDKFERVGTLLDDARQGYLIDTPTAEALGISSLEQLQDPQIARLFDLDGNGKADLIGCDRGWGCHTVIEHHLDEYGLRETVEHRFGEYDDLIKEEVMPRLEQEQPTLYYTWTPYWVSGALQPGIDVQWLTVPYTSLPGNSDATAADTTVDGKNLGFAVDQIQILANRQFLAANPAAAAFLQAVQIPVREVSLQNQRMVDRGEASLAAIRRHAERWVDRHQPEFDRWLQGARQAS